MDACCCVGTVKRADVSDEEKYETYRMDGLDLYREPMRGGLENLNLLINVGDGLFKELQALRYLLHKFGIIRLGGDLQSLLSSFNRLWKILRSRISNGKGTQGIRMFIIGQLAKALGKQDRFVNISGRKRGFRGLKPCKIVQELQLV